MDKVGFGQLNTLGGEEMQGIGAREGERLSAMFDDANAEDAKVEILDSGGASCQGQRQELLRRSELRSP